MRELIMRTKLGLCDLVTIIDDVDGGDDHLDINIMYIVSLNLVIWMSDVTRWVLYSRPFLHSSRTTSLRHQAWAWTFPEKNGK